MESPFNKAPVISQPETIEDYELQKLFGNFLFQSRKALKKSCEQFASEIGVNQRVLWRWESGDIFPEEDKLPDIARVYDVDLQDLKNKFIISKKAREKMKDARKPPKKIKPDYRKVF